MIQKREEIQKTAILNQKMTKASEAMFESIHKKWHEIATLSPTLKFSNAKFAKVSQKVSTRRGKNPFMLKHEQKETLENKTLKENLKK